MYKNESVGNYEDLSSMSSDDNNRSKVRSIIFIFSRIHGKKESSDRVHPKKVQVKLSLETLLIQMASRVDGLSKNIRHF